MPNTHTTLSGLFSDIADAIRAKTGDTAQIVADGFPAAIAGIIARCPHADVETVFRWDQLTTDGDLSWSGSAVEET